MKAKHISPGTLQAFLDSQLSASEQDRVAAHLADCSLCETRFQAQKTQSEAIRSRLDTLAAAGKPLALAQVQVRYHAYSREKEKENPIMNQPLFKRFRTAWMTAALVALLALALAFPQVRAIASSFLGLFRVQQITLVQVNDELPEQLSQSTKMEMLFSEDVHFDQQEEVKTVSSAAEASELAGFEIRLPQNLAEETDYTVTPGGQIRFKVDLDKLHAVLDEMGRSDLRLPQEVDGTEIVADIQPGVSISFGSCVEVQGDPDEPESIYYRDCTTLLQIPSPAVEAPAELDIRAIGEVYMQFLGMNAEDARAFSQEVDWANTLVVPIPVNAVEYQQVTVDGSTGTFLNLRDSEQFDQSYMLIWVKDGLVYALNGEGGLEAALAIANTLK